ncbi:MAG TPA: cupin-like domain-containing protein [Steroidobacteraceae bacterium]|nr:cupin-like domain-containing protein [Steroidobacteraceae bacterium]
MPSRTGVTPDIFLDQILPARRPMVLKGVVSDWPARRLGAQSDEALVDYLKSCDEGRPVQAMVGAAEIRGAFFYGRDTSSFNYQTGNAPLSLVLDRILEQRSRAQPESVYLQSTPIREHFPKFLLQHALPLLPPSVEPRIWIGNATVVQTHHDLKENIACVVAGKRRFTLFPPEQLGNLYLGPLDRTPAGVPISMVSLDAPDLQRYPRFAEALAVAQVADLEAGDAIYIPYGWWHHVRATTPFNVLVNYWWSGGGAALAPPEFSLLMALLALRDLPEHQLRMWKSMFDYYVFRSHGDPLQHLRPQDRGIAGASPAELQELARQMMASYLAAK